MSQQKLFKTIVIMSAYFTCDSFILSDNKIHTNIANSIHILCDYVQGRGGVSHLIILLLRRGEIWNRLNKYRNNTSHLLSPVSFLVFWILTKLCIWYVMYKYLVQMWI